MGKMIFRNRKDSWSDKIFDGANLVLMLGMLAIFTWPLWFILIASFSDPIAVNSGKVLLWPRDIVMDGYEMTLSYKELWRGYKNTIGYTVAGTLLNLVLSICMAYPLSRKDFKLRKLFMVCFVFTMYFSGGLIPTYLVVKKVGILNTGWAMIIPNAISVYNALIIRSYFVNSIPAELEEAATLDGANCAQYLLKVVLPLSKPVLAVVGLYYAVSHWNDYYNALIYLYNDVLYPLQTVLRTLLLTSSSLVDATATAADSEAMEAAFNTYMSMKYCVVIVAAVPMLCIYPFVQKFFVKGVMVGSVKG